MVLISFNAGLLDQIVGGLPSGSVLIEKLCLTGKEDKEESVLTVFRALFLHFNVDKLGVDPTDDLLAQYIILP